jgi:hypothetical protein|tara:strand:+ start:13891 stop:15933 length:2043 start_codon:yes stop_codon:yes gene_type:complete
MADQSQNLFRRLTKLFRAGPVVKRKVKDFESTSKTSSAFDLFRKNQSHVYSTAMSAYGTYDRMARYSDFSEMEYTPEISSALDIYSEETVAADEKGQVLHIHSENPTIQKLLDELFYDTLNIEFNLTPWTRNLCKYGDFFLFNDVSPDQGVINAYPMPVNEVEREEGYDPEDPMAVRFRWVTQGNQVLENWQVCHMRVLGNDAFLPYGSSVLEAARRIWRQLILVEDAMLVYRVVRSPERRVFYIDVGNVPPEDIPTYMEQVQTTLKKSQVVDKDTGRVDLRYNPLSVDEDYYLPVRGAETGTKIDTLAGGANATAIEDVEYIQKKLFAALKIPKAYLGYDEGLGAKATLSQEDIRFSRTIARIQRTVVSELNKIAIIHLFCNGFEGEDLLDFALQLSNPSTIAQQQKLELYRSRFEIAQSAVGVEGLVSRDWIRKNLFTMTDDEMQKIQEQRVEDKMEDLEVEAVKLPGIDEEGGETDELEGGGFGEEDAGETETAGDDRNTGGLPLIAGDSNDHKIKELSISDSEAPIKAQNKVDSFLKLISESDPTIDEGERKNQTPAKRDIENSKRRNKKGYTETDHQKLTSHDKDDPSDSIANPFAEKLRKQKERSERKADINPLKNAHKMNEDDLYIDDFLNSKIDYQAKMTSGIRSALKSLEGRISNTRRVIISESDNTSEGE